ncbi:mitochondrial ribosomal protein L37-domain-containing protein [Lipomyces arxii]|uniref:mitochondrial 54S ribosomal protein mL54 n=1 Tax=Lipomyces arxii TaxID=56418 RepID=UPI0034CF77F5
MNLLNSGKLGMQCALRSSFCKTKQVFLARRSLSDDEHGKNAARSSVPQGVRLRGCNILKSGQDPVALADEEYPDWLWDLLDPDAQQRKLDADPERKAKKEWRAKMRKKIKTDNFLKSMS